MSIPLLSSKPTKFVDIVAGSTIKIESTNGSFDPILDATVLEVKPEYGPHSVPALVYNTKADPSLHLLMADGSSRVTVLVSAAGLVSETLPPTAVAITSVPKTGHALQYVGGPESAAEVLRFVAGNVILRLEPERDRSPECLILRTLEQEQRIEIGSWAIRFEGGEVIFVNSDQFGADYDADEAPVSLMPGYDRR